MSVWRRKRDFCGKRQKKKIEEETEEREKGQGGEGEKRISARRWRVQGS